jgi:Na+-driven multidrug efflux pump
MPISVYFGLFTPLGAAGLWWGFVAGLGAVAVFLLVRIKTRFSRDLVRIILDVERPHTESDPARAG